MKKRITLYVDEHIWRQFRAACVTRSKSASEVVDLFMEDQVIRWGVERGREDISAGKFISHEEMIAELDRVIEDADHTS